MTARTRAKPQRDGSAVYEIVREMAIEYRFRPGEDIREAELAERLGVSRTPVRATLWRLVGEGLVEARRNRGFRCRDLGLRAVTELIALARLLHRAVAPDALRAAPEARAALAADARRQAESWPHQPPCERARADEAFLNAFARLSGNASAAAMLERVNAQLRFFRKIGLEREADAHACFATHVALAEALERDDEAALDRAVAALPPVDDRSVAATLEAGMGRLYLSRNAMDVDLKP